VIGLKEKRIISDNIAGKVGTPREGLLIALIVAVTVTVVYTVIRKKKDNAEI
jgi:hypothetical protein